MQEMETKKRRQMSKKDDLCVYCSRIGFQFHLLHLYFQQISKSNTLPICERLQLNGIAYFLQMDILVLRICLWAFRWSC